VTVSEAFTFLYDYFGSCAGTKADFIVQTVGALLTGDDGYGCTLLDQSVKYLDNIFSGANKITHNDADYIMEKKSVYHLEAFLKDNLPTSPDRIDELEEDLQARGYEVDGTDEKLVSICAGILISSINERRKIRRGRRRGSSSNTRAVQQTPGASLQSAESTMEAIDEVERVLAALPRPRELPVPPIPLDVEHKYIHELYRAYTDAEENKGVIGEDNISQFADYADDLKDRRIDYFAAESIRRGLEELKRKPLQEQFAVLKSETLAGVKDTARRKHANGYDHMLAVMEQASGLQVERYLLSRSPYWISTPIKKGVCHFLVNDGDLKWVK
jgi:hypothetical protein